MRLVGREGTENSIRRRAVLFAPLWCDRETYRTAKDRVLSNVFLPGIFLAQLTRAPFYV